MESPHPKHISDIAFKAGDCQSLLGPAASGCPGLLPQARLPGVSCWTLLSPSHAAPSWQGSPYSSSSASGVACTFVQVRAWSLVPPIATRSGPLQPLALFQVSGSPDLHGSCMPSTHSVSLSRAPQALQACGFRPVPILLHSFLDEGSPTLQNFSEAATLKG